MRGGEGGARGKDFLSTVGVMSLLSRVPLSDEPVLDRQPSRRPTVTESRLLHSLLLAARRRVSVVARDKSASFSRARAAWQALLSRSQTTGGAAVRVRARCGFPPVSSWSRFGEATSIEAGRGCRSRLQAGGRSAKQLTGGGKAARAAGSPRWRRLGMVSQIGRSRLTGPWANSGGG